MEDTKLLKDSEFEQINQLYDECLSYLKNYQDINILESEKKRFNLVQEDPDYETIKEVKTIKPTVLDNFGKDVTQNGFYEPKMDFKVENEMVTGGSVNSLKSERLRKLSKQLPKIIITQSNTSLDLKEGNRRVEDLIAPSEFVRRPNR